MTEPTHLNAEELDWLNACKDEAIVVTLFERLDAARRELAESKLALADIVNYPLNQIHTKHRRAAEAVLLPAPPTQQEHSE